jgi:hypothetical protein
MGQLFGYRGGVMISEHAQAIALSDEQLDAVMRAAVPLAPADRGRFLEAVAARLRGRVIGDGVVYLAIKEAQRAYFDPPIRLDRAPTHPSR